MIIKRSQKFTIMSLNRIIWITFQELVEMVKAKKSAQALAMQLSQKWTAKFVNVEILGVIVRRD